MSYSAPEQATRQVGGQIQQVGYRSRPQEGGEELPEHAAGQKEEDCGQKPRRPPSGHGQEELRPGQQEGARQDVAEIPRQKGPERPGGGGDEEKAVAQVEGGGDRQERQEPVPRPF